MKKTKKIILIVICVLEALILTFLLGGTIFLESKLGKINRRGDFVGYTEEELAKLEAEENKDKEITGEIMESGTVDWGNDATQIGGGKNTINILLIGQDRRAGEGRCRSDAMILCTINKSEKTLTMTSFMRDMYVQIPGYLDNRINASYAFGGIELLDACIYKNFGVVIDGNIEVDFFGFQEVIDLMGGVEIELTAAEAEYLNRRGNWDIETNAGTWNLKEGVNRLNGSQALAYSRIRYVGNGDFGRTNRQRTVLTALANQSKGLSVTQANKLLDKILPLLTTDMSDKEIMRLVMDILPMLSDLSVNNQQIPADGAYKDAYFKDRNMAVLIPDLQKNREILAEIMKE